MDLKHFLKTNLYKDLRFQVALFCLLPPFIVAVSIGFYVNFAFLEQEKNRQSKRVSASLQQVAQIVSLEFSNLRLIRSVLVNSLEVDGLKAVGVFNIEGKQISHAGLSFKNLDKLESALPNENKITFFDQGKTQLIITPIGQSPIEDHHLIKETNSNIKGWVVGEYYQHQFNQFMRLHQFRQNLILFVALMVAIFLAYLFYQRLIQEVKNIKKNIKLIELNDQNATSFSHYFFNEFDQIDEAVKSLNKSRENDLKEVTTNIELISGDLQQTIETIEVQNIELSIAQREALKANKMKSEFLANTSHELRTPLNGIIGFTRMLQKTATTRNQREYLETIMNSAEGLLTIINDILDFSKLEANKLKLEKTPVNLRFLLEDVISLLAPSAYEKKLELILFIYQDVPLQVISDPLRLKQIFYNLISNAIKFTQEGEIIIRIELKESTQNELVLLCHVADTGIGMTTQQQEDLFQAFYQADTSRAREYGGTGLGLTIAQTLIDLFGGNINVDSEIEKGTTFTFTLNLNFDNCLLEPDKPLAQFQVGLISSNDTNSLALGHILEGFGLGVQRIDKISSLQQTIDLHCIDAVVIDTSCKDSTDHIQQQVNKTTQITPIPILLLQPILTPLINMNITKIRFCHKPIREGDLLKQCKKLLIKNALIQPPTISKNTFNDCRIVIADDNEANLKLLHLYLSEFKCMVFTAKNGIEAIDQTKQHLPDLIFMDIQMPYVNGIEASEVIRSFSDIPIIALTAHIIDTEKKALFSAGINDCLTKPINEYDIETCLNRYYLSTKPIKNVQAPSIKDHLIDKEKSLKLAKGKTEIAQDMLSMLITSVPDTLIAIEKNIATNQFSALYDEIHKLHGAACYTSIRDLKPLCKVIEEAIKIDQQQEIISGCNKLKSILEALLEFNKKTSVKAFFAANTESTIED